MPIPPSLDELATHASLGALQWHAMGMQQYRQKRQSTSVHPAARGGREAEESAFGDQARFPGRPGPKGRGPSWRNFKVQTQSHEHKSQLTYIWLCAVRSRPPPAPPSPLLWDGAWVPSSPCGLVVGVLGLWV